MKKKLILISFIFISTVTYSQQLNKKGTFLVSVNPLKLVYGIINIEFEYQISSALSMQLGTEYVLTNYIIKKEKHPDFVIRIGPRYHIFNNKDYGDRNDLYLGAFTGYFWSKSVGNMKFFNIGTEVGYKYQFGTPVYINSKMFITSPIPKPRIIPGFECLFGYVLK